MKFPRARAAPTASAAGPSSRRRRAGASPRRRSLFTAPSARRAPLSARSPSGTVYRHFPDERALIGACSAHWNAANPRPDIAGWAAVEDPDDRLRSALSELYAWYDRTEYMVERITRDAAVVEPLREAMGRAAGWYEAATGVLAEGRPGDAARARAAIAHALAFDTWRSLVRRQGLAPEEAVELMERLASCA